MPKKPSNEEIAYAFRHALAHNLSEADKLLSAHSGLIDRPVFGDSETALHFFSVEKQSEIVKWLLARGANPNGIADDDSPLHGAAQLGHEEVCRLLLEAGANPNAQDFIEETPLHKASASGHVAVIQMLLKNGADPSVAEMCGELPIDQALPRKRDQVRAAFVETMGILLTPITASDLEGIDEWLSESDLLEYMSGWTPRSVREENWRPELCRWDFIVADKRKIGTVWLERSAIGDPVADLGILIAEPVYRGLGIGTEVIRRVEHEAKGNWGTTRVRLRVRASNANAIACYERLGFSHTGTTTRKHGSTEVVVLHMEHDLGPTNPDIT